LLLNHACYSINAWTSAAVEVLGDKPVLPPEKAEGVERDDFLVFVLQESDEFYEVASEVSGWHTMKSPVGSEIYSRQEVGPYHVTIS
jgi:hypothetical protein